MIPGDYLVQRPGFSAMNHFAKYGPYLLTTDRNITSGDGSSPSVRTFFLQFGQITPLDGEIRNARV